MSSPSFRLFSLLLSFPLLLLRRLLTDLLGFMRPGEKWCTVLWSDKALLFQCVVDSIGRSRSPRSRWFRGVCSRCNGVLGGFRGTTHLQTCPQDAMVLAAFISSVVNLRVAHYEGVDFNNPVYAVNTIRAIMNHARSQHPPFILN